MTTIEVAGTAVDYSEWSVTAGTSDATLAPVATVETAARAATVSAGDRLEIKRDDGTTVFVGDIVDAPTRRNGAQKLTCEHDYHRVFEESVTLSLSSPTAETVLEQALAASDGGAAGDLTYSAASVTISDGYEVETRSVKRVFRDMADRVGAVWWVDTGDAVTFDEPGDRGVWATLDATTDRFVVTEYDAADLETVVNDQTVVGTGAERVTGSAEDTTSISEYGRREGDPVNVNYIETVAEAEAYAQKLLQPDPESAAELVVPDGVGGDTSQILANYRVDVSDPDGTGMNDTLVVEEQVIEEGRATLQLGAASARGKITVNRSAKSRDDTTEPGSVYGSDRIADGAVGDTELVDLSVTEDKLANLSVALDKIQDGAVEEQKLANLSVALEKVQDGAIQETKISDSAVSTPKLQAEAVTAAEILADTITANEVATDTLTANEIAADTITAAEVLADTLTANEIAADTITATEVETGTLTANEIDTLELSTGQLFVGTDADEGILFDTEAVGSQTATRMRPSANGLATIGTDTSRFLNVYMNSLFCQAARFETSSGSVFFEPEGGEPSLYPETDNTGTLGTLSFGPNNETRAWADVVTHNVTTVTPEPLSDVAWDGVRGHSWRSPPQYVAQKKAAGDDDREYRRANPNREGVDLGHMTNYLLETVKSQAEKIEELEERLADLEERLATLEGNA